MVSNNQSLFSNERLFIMRISSSHAKHAYDEAKHIEKYLCSITIICREETNVSMVHNIDDIVGKDRINMYVHIPPFDYID